MNSGIGNVDIYDSSYMKRWRLDTNGDNHTIILKSRIFPKSKSARSGFSSNYFPINTYLDQFVIMFMDDIFIYSPSHEAHEQHLNTTFETLQEQKLYPKFSKYEFWLESIAFLGDVIFEDRILVDPTQIETILKWERPKNVIDIRSFVGLDGFARWFIKEFLLSPHH